MTSASTQRIKTMKASLLKVSPSLQLVSLVQTGICLDGTVFRLYFLAVWKYPSTSYSTTIWSGEGGVQNPSSPPINRRQQIRHIPNMHVVEPPNFLFVGFTEFPPFSCCISLFLDSWPLKKGGIPPTYQPPATLLKSQPKSPKVKVCRPSGRCTDRRF